METNGTDQDNGDGGEIFIQPAYDCTTSDKSSKILRKIKHYDGYGIGEGLVEWAQSVPGLSDKYISRKEKFIWVPGIEQILAQTLI